MNVVAWMSNGKIKKQNNYVGRLTDFNRKIIWVNRLNRNAEIQQTPTTNSLSSSKQGPYL